jgi:hypothetical protein
MTGSRAADGRGVVGSFRSGAPARCLAIAMALALAACGSTYFTSPTKDLLDPSQPREPDPVVTVTAAGLSPQTLHVSPAVPTRIVNQDTVDHAFTAALDQGYGDCPEMKGLGRIAAGQTVAVSIQRYGVCAFRDASQPTNPAFLGLIVVH